MLKFPRKKIIKIFELDIFIALSLTVLITSFLTISYMRSELKKEAYLKSWQADASELAKNTKNSMAGKLISVSDDPYVTYLETPENSIKYPATDQDDPYLGSLYPKLVLIGYSDYTCKFCGQQEEIIKKVVEENKNDIAFIRKDYPENNPDSISFKSAVAVRCAGKQEKYWEYHDLLYKTENLTEESFIELAKKTDLKQSDFKDCINNQEVSEKIQQNITEANALNIEGIPYLFIGDQQFIGELSYQELKEEIARLLK